MTVPSVSPLDEANRQLLERVRPIGWTPKIERAYDLIVIGGGTAGLVSAMGAGGLGARVALIERALLGGDCLNVGCVPSKAILRSSRAVAEARAAQAAGLAPILPSTDFFAVMERMRRLRAEIAKHDSAQRLASAGVDVLFGDAQFADQRHVVVGGRQLRFRRAVIATGGRPAAPPVPGLAETGYLTNETVFSLTDLPRRLLIIGAGPTGCELAQAFALFGSHVTVVDTAARPLPSEDPDASAIIQRRLTADGVRFELGASLQEVSRGDAGIIASWTGSESKRCVEVDVVLVAAGRLPNIETLNLDAAGVKHGPSGIAVNERMQTSNRRVYAAGDVAAPWKFTHAADATARLVLQNALFYGRRRMSSLVVPWCTYTSPEVAHVGASYTEAAARGAANIIVPFENLDRAVLDDASEGFVRIHHVRGRILGGTIVGPRAGESIGHLGDVIRRDGRLGELAAIVFPYPSYAEALRAAGDAYRRSIVTPRVRKWLLRYFAAMRTLSR